MPTGVDEASVEAGLLRVHGDDGAARGSAFRILADGTAITCDHVVEGLGQIEVEDALGNRAVVRSIERFPDVDLALLRSALTGDSLPLGTRVRPARGSAS
jgi:S1-C subfamily serine protease